MKKYLLLFSVLVLFLGYALQAIANDYRYNEKTMQIEKVSNSPKKEIFCDMNVVARQGNYYKEDRTTASFIIDDEDKALYFTESGTKKQLVGNIIVFNESEISINNIFTNKNHSSEVYINRKSGSIYLKRIEPNIWIGDTITEYKGYCVKQDKPLF